ncbi:hypoxia up-regulated protein 1 [Trichonephila clavipes]|nr:hypoxia up-regulated protein 1 [Trichonephila clavipes]
MKQVMSFLFVTIGILSIFHSTQGLAVMSLDIGSEWMKVAIVSPGVPMEIALNRESQRKTPVVVSFRDGERIFGDPALTIGVRFPEKTFMYLMDIIGKTIDNPVVELYKKRFPFYNIQPTENRKSVLFKHPEGMEFTVEELVAMLLKQAQEIAQKAAVEWTMTRPLRRGRRLKVALALLLEVGNHNLLFLLLMPPVWRSQIEAHKFMAKG